MSNDNKLWSVSAEAGVLGSMILDGKCVSRVSSILDAGMFFKMEHATIYDVLLTLYATKRPTDVVLLREELTKLNQLEEIGGVEYIAKILDTTPTAASAVYYAEIVAEKARRRQMVQVVEEIKAVPDQPIGLNEQVDRIQEIANTLQKPAQMVFEVSKEVDAWYEGVIAGEIQAITWPWHLIGNLTQSLLPKSLTLLCGAPGSGKSLLILQCLTHWRKANIKVAVFELEISKLFHLRRALAQRVENSSFSDVEWVRDNPEPVRQVLVDNKDFLDDFGKCVYAEPNKDVSLGYLKAWVEQRAKEGCRVIAVDPVTIASREQNVWVADLNFVLSLREIADEYNVSIVLVTHPRKTMGGQKVDVSMDALAGGSAYQRFTDTILWLQSFPSGKEFKINTPVGTSTFEVNRSIRILKANNGRGAGMGIAFKFYPESLTLGEQGLIIPEDK